MSRDGESRPPDRAESRSEATASAPPATASVPERSADTNVPGNIRAHRYTWPELMKRVFRLEVLECPRCGETSRILAAIHPPETTVAILECLKLPTRAPPLTPPDPVEQPELDGFDFDG